MATSLNYYRSTFPGVLCSAPDQREKLKRLRRVLRDGAEPHIYEYATRDDNPSLIGSGASTTAY